MTGVQRLEAMTQEENIRWALNMARDLRNVIKAAGAPQSLKRARSLVKSLEGAQRHAGRRVRGRTR